MDFNKIIDKGLALGFDAIEIYVKTTESNTLKLDDGKLDSYNIKAITGLSIRGLYQEKMAYTYTEDFEEEAIDRTLNDLFMSVKLIDLTEPDFMYEGGSEYEQVEECNSDYKQHSTKEKVDMLKKLEKDLLAKSEKIKKVGYCQYTETLSNVKIINSKGLNLEKSYSFVSAVLGALAEENGQTTVGYAGDVNVNFADLELDRIVDEASKYALEQLGAGQVDSGSYPVVLDRNVATQILSAFSSVFSGASALEKTTILKDKEGQKVFGENITILDDPFYKDALVKTSFDDEGVPCKTKMVVENGVFNGLLHNLKTAAFFNTTSTGNGAKSGSCIIGVAPTNMFIKEGEKSEEEIISTVENGIFVREVNGLHAGLNKISGDFNVQASGFIIKDGKFDRPITLFVLSGNFYTMMNDVEEIGNNIEKRFNGIASPTLKIKSLAISGK